MSSHPPRNSLQTRELMTASTVTVGPSTRLRDAQQILERYAIRHLPVLEDDRIVGILSDRDISQALGMQQEHELVHDRLDWPVSRVMNFDAIVVHEQTPVTDVIDLLCDRRIGALPVVSADDETVVGIISSVDILRAAKRYFR